MGPRRIWLSNTFPWSRHSPFLSATRNRTKTRIRLPLMNLKQRHNKDTQKAYKSNTQVEGAKRTRKSWKLGKQGKTDTALQRQKSNKEKILTSRTTAPSQFSKFLLFLSLQDTKNSYHLLRTYIKPNDRNKLSQVQRPIQQLGSCTINHKHSNHSKKGKHQAITNSLKNFTSQKTF